MIIEKLTEFIELTNKHKSSHWKSFLNNKNIYDNKSMVGFGTFSNKNLFKSILHLFFQFIIFDIKIFKTKTFSTYKNIYKKTNRQIDFNCIRHVFTLDLLRKYKSFKNICVIGDGKANFVLGALSIFPNAKIFSVNLAEVLINDYLILSKHNIINDNKIEVIENINQTIDENNKLYLIPANLKTFLNYKNIDLFVNINSFQEMTVDEINEYFKIIKSNNSFLYCCNRESKTLYGGEKLIFDNYNWGSGKKIIYEECSWSNKYYDSTFPFIHKLDGKTLHALIDYS